MIRIPDTLSVSRLDDELVLLDERTGRYYGLNAVGSRIFQLLKESGDPDRALETLLSEYEVPESRLRSDVAAFVELLTEKGLASADAT